MIHKRLRIVWAMGMISCFIAVLIKAIFFEITIDLLGIGIIGGTFLVLYLVFSDLIDD